MTFHYLFSQKLYRYCIIFCWKPGNTDIVSFFCWKYRSLSISLCVFVYISQRGHLIPYSYSGLAILTNAARCYATWVSKRGQNFPRVVVILQRLWKKKKKFNCWTYGMSTNSKEEYDMIKTLQVNADTNIQTHIIFNLINFTIKLHTTQLHKSLLT